MMSARLMNPQMERKRFPDLKRDKSLLLGWVGSFTIALGIWPPQPLVPGSRRAIINQASNMQACEGQPGSCDTDGEGSRIHVGDIGEYMKMAANSLPDSIDCLGQLNQTSLSGSFNVKLCKIRGSEMTDVLQKSIGLRGKLLTTSEKMVNTSLSDEEKRIEDKESKEETILAMLGIIGTILNLVVIIFVYIYTTL
ncbi:hypothetical protein P4O66_001665 [Electrophorus voltai]|uniref:Uncharacterized protein n=1 Tax=Electrophorus voltai TaxID=2609070 RepID=A0AAD8Z5E9_9TELE|nr:hypothetical protein P4O66_001665 [Electrophorus voltai]